MAGKITAIVAAAVMLASCSSTGDRSEDNYDRAVREGNYSLIIMGAREGAEEMAVMDLEGDPFELAPEEGMGERERVSGLSPGEAITLADQSLGGRGVILKAIEGDDNVIVGYEVYPPALHGPAHSSGPDTEPVLLPNLLRIDYTVSPSGRPRVRVITLPMRDPSVIVPAD